MSPPLLRVEQAPGFYITGCRGFLITFENGWTVSVQFGGRNYCDNYDMEIGSERKRDLGSSDAEVAAWPADGSMVEWPEGDVVLARLARQSPAQVLDILNRAAAGTLPSSPSDRAPE